MVLVGFQSLPDLRECLSALTERPSVPQEVILVDNASTDGTADFVRERYPEVVIIRSKTNRGFAWACNRGAAVARGRVLVFLNCDTIVQQGWVTPLLQI